MTDYRGYGAAFPEYDAANGCGTSGMTKRELFAAMAMQGIVSNPHTAHLPSAGVASCATTLADALLRALEARSE